MKAEFFIWQMYTTEERWFITLQMQHLRCNHDREPKPEYNIGDTVLVLIPGCGIKKLQVFELLEYIDNYNRSARLQQLRRRREFNSKCKYAPNELIHTKEETFSLAEKITTRCLV